jgi:CrcB protein
MLLMQLLLVMLGGAAGSGLRYLVAQLLPTAVGTMPLSTLIINVVGSGVLGALTMLASHHTSLSREWMLLLGTGLCGGFTTFSTVAVELLTMTDHGRLALAIVYALLSMLLGLAAAAGAAAFVRMLSQP